MQKKLHRLYLASLNSGLQLYRLKYEHPEVFHQIKYSLHLPQYLSFIFSSINSIRYYKYWLPYTCYGILKKTNIIIGYIQKNLHTKFPPIQRSNEIVNIPNDTRNIAIGIGLHDSSAALIPYLKFFKEPFVLLSTGTWCISLNPFNHSLLTDYELQHDCLMLFNLRRQPGKSFAIICRI